MVLEGELATCVVPSSWSNTSTNAGLLTVTSEFGEDNKELAFGELFTNTKESGELINKSFAFGY